LERVGRGKLLLHCRLLGGARRFGANGGGEGREHIVAAAGLQLVDYYIANDSTANLCAIDISKAFDKVNHYA